MSSMSYNAAAGLSGMLKSGTRHMQDEDPYSGGVVLRNIEACLQLTRMLQSSMGPQGRCKLVVNHLEKRIVTSDCASVLKEVEIEHPAAQLLATACRKQEEECGDNTNFVLSVAGELLWQTSILISKMTWQPAPEILAGYQSALQKIESELLPSLVCDEVTDITDKNQLLKVLKPVLASKQYGSEDVLAPLVADACLKVMDKNASGKASVPVDAIRTVKLVGSSVSESTLLEGYVAQRGLETVCTSATKAKIAVYACGFEASSTEAKGTVLMKTADDLTSYNRSEEKKMQEIVESIKESGVKVIVTGGTLSDMALHFLDRNDMLCLKVGSKWDLRRFCQAVGATALVRLGPPTPEEVGYCEKVETKELGGRTVTIFQSAEKEGKLATIVLRASTLSVLADLERAVDDGVQAVAQAAKDGRLVYGGGAIEMALSTKLLQYAQQQPGLEQYAIHAFAKALQVIPRTLAENSGWDATRAVADLQAAHSVVADASGSICDTGIDIERERAAGASTTTGMKEKGVVDLLRTKLSALRLAIDAVVTILKVDQIIMSKPSGGPNMAGG